MDTLIQNKKAVVALVIVLLGFYLFSVLMSPEPGVENNVEASPDASLVDLSEELSKITFKQDLFSNAGYKMLVDFSTPLPTQEAGRPNPFGQIGRD